MLKTFRENNLNQAVYSHNKETELQCVLISENRNTSSRSNVSTGSRYALTVASEERPSLLRQVAAALSTPHSIPENLSVLRHDVHRAVHRDIFLWQNQTDAPMYE